MVKFEKRLSLAILIICILQFTLLVSCSNSNPASIGIEKVDNNQGGKSQDSTENDKKTVDEESSKVVGNSSSNLKNGGLVVHKDGWIYYCNTDDE